MQEYKSKSAKLVLAAKGFAMGLCDIIPGVSGGTIALISGIYDQFIRALGSAQLSHALALVNLVVFCWHAEKRRAALAELATIEWNFLIPLGIGIVSALLIMTMAIPYILENYAYYAYAFFFGLILFSITVPLRMMRRRPAEFALLVVAAVAVFFLVGISRVSDARIELSAGNSAANNNDSEGEQQVVYSDAKGTWEIELPREGAAESFSAQVTTRQGKAAGSFVLTVPARQGDEALEALAEAVQFSEVELSALGISVKEIEAEGDRLALRGRLISEGSTWPPYVLFSGALAICAMILPGISGAYILVILGQYKLVVSALRDTARGLPDLLRGQELAPGFGDAVVTVAFFVVGVAVGIFSFVRILRYVLKNYPSLTMAILTGLMIGSLRGLWPPAHLHDQPLDGGLIAAGIGLTVAGAVLIFALERISGKSPATSGEHA